MLACHLIDCAARPFTKSQSPKDRLYEMEKIGTLVMERKEVHLTLALMIFVWCFFSVGTHKLPAKICVGQRTQRNLPRHLARSRRRSIPEPITRLLKTLALMLAYLLIQCTNGLLRNRPNQINECNYL